MTTVVMVIAFSGLGCHNKGCDGSCGTSSYYASGQSETNLYPSAVVPSGHPAHSYGKFGGCDASGSSFRDGLHKTLYSFVFGHDPDVPTVQEIEASLESGGYGNPGGYGR